MKRDIKFRVWHKSLNHATYRAEPSASRPADDSEEALTIFYEAERTRQERHSFWEMYYPTDFGCWGYQFGWSTGGHVDLGTHESYTNEWHKKSILQQFTGLKDKNGKEIYEGDVVKQSLPGAFEEIGTIKYLWHAFMFCTMDGAQCNPPGVSGTEIEVIGNIFENPELLK